MYDSALPFPVGGARAGTNGQLDGLLGALFIAPTGKAYRLCKATAVIATAASRVLKIAFTLGVPTWNVDFPTAGNLDLSHVVVPAGQVGTGATSTSLAASDYFWGQVSGSTSFKGADTAATTVMTDGLPLRVTTAGYVSSYTASPATGAINEWPSNLSRITNTAAPTSVAAVIPGMLVGLI